MTELITANREDSALEATPTRYIEGSVIRFAYRRLGPSAGMPAVLLQHFSGNIDAWDLAVVMRALRQGGRVGTEQPWEFRTITLRGGGAD